ncbi:hypothetical protein ADK65_04205 [Streptomyces sp. NRRL B-1140]|uniref:hypothetical protein n=1 Tax=Streptomyces sp. NRRL B-1140 TaxID=1415549 RepID=UPI0006ADDD98|nr:hypothetical protein [Streptomyces sp. NRRL B-1140]KOX04363.1 hypothetical protein ADK65_04205 [Streptomyces sp. NRRL B-1140]
MHQNDNPLVLALDYPGYRKEARIEELGLERHGFRVHNLLRGPLPRAVSGSGYAARLLANVPSGAGPVAAVAAYCASAPLAFEVAAALGGRPPAIVLFDAEATSPETIAADYRARLAGLGVPPDEREPSRPVDAVALTDDPERLVDELTGELARRARAALRAAGADEAESAASATHMVSAYTDWLTHLVAAHHARTRPWEGEVLRLGSADSDPFGFPCAAGRSSRALRLNCDRFELLRSEETRAVVLEALGLADTPDTGERTARCPAA